MAIKILPAAFASDPERLARFEREAKTLASLNYPNIAQIYGFEAFRSIQMSGASIEAGPPAVRFEGAPATLPNYFQYQPTAAGQRFLAIVDAGIIPRLTVVLNWRARSGQ